MYYSNSEDRLADFYVETERVIPKRKKIIIITSVFLLLGLNLFFAINNIPDYVVNPGEEGISHKYKIIGAVFSVLFVIPIAAFLIAIPATFIPFKGASYKKKYLLFALINTLILEGFLFLILLSTLL